MFRITGMVAGLFALAACSPDTSQNSNMQDQHQQDRAVSEAPPTEQISSTQRDTPAPINSVATMTYSREMFPKLVQKFGPTIPTINRERTAAAKITALDTRCDEVMNVQVTSRSTTGNRRYYAECRNRARLYFDAASIAAGHPAGIQSFDDIKAEGLEDW